MMTTPSAKQSNSSTNDPISEVLDVVPLKDIVPQKQVSVSTPTVDMDFEFARGNLLSILSKGSEAVDDLLAIAQQSQHPRAYEVLSGLIKNLSETNKDLLELSKKKKDLEKEDPSSNPQTINNNLFVGSTTELQKLLKQNNE